MPNKKKIDFDVNDIFTQIKDKISLDTDTEPYIPDIMEFCTSKKYLALPVTLFPVQKIILKAFYRGQRGNEHIKLTEDELKLLVELKLDNVIEKYRSKHLFRELVLVLGRRSGKDFMTAIMALYEAMKLLECSGGSPFTYYDLAPGNPIYILTVATSGDQAGILFREMKSKMQTSPYFIPKIGKIGKEEIYLQTPEDKQNNKMLEEKGIGEINPGNIVIMSGHSNSESLLGKRIYTLLLDEVASFKTTGSSSSGDRIYSSLTPATADFKMPDKYDDNGDKLLDSKIISISSPRGEEGVLYKLYKTANESNRRLAFKLPTWKVNLSQKEDSLRNEFQFMSPTEFEMEFGAMFAGTGGEKFISDKYIDQAVELGKELGLKNKVIGRPEFVYYCHLDPGTSSHNYALTVLHIEDRIRQKERENGTIAKERYKLFVVDHIKIWQPTVGNAVKISDVDDYVINLHKSFRLAMVSWDRMESTASMQKLRAKGIPTKQTAFRKQYKMTIYDQLEELLVANHLALPSGFKDAEILEMELKCLKRIWSIGNTFKIQPDPEASITTDDSCDSLAGAIGEAMAKTYTGYPRGTTVRMPISRDMGEQKWQMGNASLGNSQWQKLQRKFGKWG